MNKTFKYALITIGIIAFIELQVVLGLCIVNAVKNNNSPHSENTFEKMNFPGNMPSGNSNFQPGDDDISKDAITPGNNSSNKKSNTNNSNTSA